MRKRKSSYTPSPFDPVTSVRALALLIALLYVVGFSVGACIGLVIGPI